MKCVTGKDGFLATNSLLVTSVLFSLLATLKSRENHGDRAAAEPQATSIGSKEWKWLWIL